MLSKTSGRFLLLLIVCASLCGVCCTSFAQTLTNGQRHLGTITAASPAQTWSFSSAAGTAVMLRVGSTNFPPRIRVLDGSNAQIAEFAAANSGTRDVVLPFVTTNGGNYSVIVSSANAAVGTFALYFAQAPGEFITPAEDDGGSLASGANNSANMALGDLDLWKFTAPAGGGFMLRMGGAFTPWLRVFDPSGVLVAEAVSASTGTRDVVLSGAATNAGAYTVIASSTVSGGVGVYSLSLALVPAEVMVTPGDQGGDLLNGSKASAEITLGDLDVWRFAAAAGDRVHLRMGGAFTPSVRLYGPDGAIVGEAVSANTGTRDVLLERRATNAGVYVVVASSTVASGVGAYELTLARVPADFSTAAGDEGGALTNGASTSGSITVGDLDLWQFQASAGDAILLRMGGAFTPKIQLYGPNGDLVEEAVSASTGTRDVTLETKAPLNGTYVVLASSTVASGAGAYTLHLAKLPFDYEVSEGDEGGEIASGARNPGSVIPGDMDLWSFEATAGESLFLRIGAEFAPWLRVYGPDGAQAGAVNSPSTGTRDLALNTTATNAGTYVVVVAAAVASGTGAYDLHLVRGLGAVQVSPGDEGGMLANGATNIATLALGDLDAWNFFGTVGDSNVFRVTAANFAPWVRVYGPVGTLVAESVPPNTSTRSATLIYELTANPGQYTVVVSSGVSGQSGGYTFKQSRWAPDLNVPQNAAVNEGEPVFYSITSQDPDEPAKTLQFELLSGPAQAAFSVVGPTNATIGWSTSEADGPLTNTVIVKVTDVVNGRAFSRTNAFAVIVREINAAPQLTVPSNREIDELSPMNAAASATDPDLPVNPLTFSLLEAPAGMTINPATGAIAWTPTEGQGPSPNTVTVVVTDDSPHAANEKNLSDTNSFVVTVREVNAPPVLVVPAAQTFDELTPLVNVTAAASDSDLPANPLTYSLVDPPAGMTIDPATGAISWVPTEAQGPVTLPIRVRVTDNNPIAVNQTQLSVTNTFNVTVWEVNKAPVLSVPASQSVNEDQAVSLQASATDADLPANTLTFSLLNPPAGMSIALTNGLISWTPSEAQGGTTNVISVVVRDSNPDAWMDPVLATTNIFTLIVAELNSSPVLPAQTNRSIVEGIALTVTNGATDADLPANSLTYALTAGPTNATISAAGVISWIPTEAQGPGAFTFTTMVTDNGSPARSATNEFTVTVTETNTAPTLQLVAPQQVRFGELWTHLLAAADADIPTNQLKFVLEQGPTNLALNDLGELSWTPVQAQIGVHSVRVRVTDNGTPPLSTEMTFQITVAGEESRLEIGRLAGGLIQIAIFGNVGLNYRLERSQNLTNWEQQSEFRLTASPLQYIDPDPSQARDRRFYRLRTVD